MNIVTLSVFHHRGEKQIKIEFAYNSKLVSALKTAGAKWSKTVSSWYIAYSKLQRYTVKTLVAQPSFRNGCC